VKQLLVIVSVVLSLWSVSCGTSEQVLHVSSQQPWSKQIADSFILNHPGYVTYDSGSPSKKWNYEQGLMLVAFYKLWQHTQEGRYFEFIQKNIDQFIGETGEIKTYSVTDYNSDNIAPGRVLLALYQETKQEKYRKAAELLRKQISEQPRTNEGGFWHKKIYPYQMWLDGLFMVEPFYAMYSERNNDIKAFDDIVNQFVWMTNHTRDTMSGLLYHGWDESKQQKWANRETGCSPSFWGRSMGWYGMGLIDVLDYLPDNHPQRNTLIGYLQDWAKAVVTVRDKESRLWYQVLDQQGKEGNYLESSASCMFTYVMAKGANKGYLEQRYTSIAQESFNAIVRNFITRVSTGTINLSSTCGAVGLGGTPYRDGSYTYYTTVSNLVNDKRGVGSFLLAAIEIEKAQSTRDPK